MNPAAEWLQYGALGGVALFAVYAVRSMFARLTAAYDAERARADRLEAELRALNEVIRTEYVETISRSSQAIADALSAVRRQ